jgi:hypothetical protein
VTDLDREATGEIRVRIFLDENERPQKVVEQQFKTVKMGEYGCKIMAYEWHPVPVHIEEGARAYFKDDGTTNIHYETVKKTKRRTKRAT